MGVESTPAAFNEELNALFAEKTIRYRRKRIDVFIQPHVVHDETDRNLPMLEIEFDVNWHFKIQNERYVYFV